MKRGNAEHFQNSFTESVKPKKKGQKFTGTLEKDSNPACFLSS